VTFIPRGFGRTIHSRELSRRFHQIFSQTESEGEEVMKIRLWIVRVLLALALLGAGLAGTLLLVVDPNDFKPQIVQAVRDNLGRELSITGDLDLEFFPYLAVRIGEIELGNSDGFAGPFMALTGAHLKARLLPLLSSRLEVVAVEIDGLSLFLARDGEGRGNWMDLATPAEADGGSNDTPVLARDKRVPFWPVSSWMAWKFRKPALSGMIGKAGRALRSAEYALMCPILRLESRSSWIPGPWARGVGSPVSSISRPRLSWSLTA
jgi:hypothetical protein